MPGFCIFYTETNERTLIMRKLHWLFMVVCLAVMPALQSCDDNDGYSIGDFTPPLWATVLSLIHISEPTRPISIVGSEMCIRDRTESV